MPYLPPSRTELLDLLKRLQGTGYAKDDGSVRVVELEAVAEVARAAYESLGVASANAFSSSVNELASATEYSVQLPTDDGLTIADRRDRLTAFTQFLPVPTAERTQAALARYLGAANMRFAGTSVGAANDERPPRSYVFSGGAATGPEIEASRILLSRAEPATCVEAGAGVGQLTYSTTFTSSADAYIAHWDTGLGAVNAQTIPETASLLVTQGEPVTMDLLNEIRRSLFWAPRADSAHPFIAKNTDSDLTYRMGQWVVAVGSIAAGGAATLDTGEWGSVFLDAYGVWSSTDIRTSDWASLPSTDRVWQKAAKTGASVQMRDLTGANSSAILGRDGSGLFLQNSAGSTRYFVLFIRTSARWASSADSHTSYEAVAHTTQLPSNDVTWMMRAASINDVNATTGWTRTLVMGGTQRGAIRRVLYTGPTATSAVSTADVPNTITLDTSIDWRNRYLLVMGTALVGTTIAAANWDQLTPQSLPAAAVTGVARLLYTGASGGSAATYCLSIGTAASQPWKLFADPTTGHLKATHSGGGTQLGCAMFFVLATPTSSDTAMQAPLHATYVTPTDLMQPQNSGCWQQGWPSRKRQNFGDTAQVVPTNPPLGLIGEGTPPVPLQWTVRERCGYAIDTTHVQRQRLFGQRKRMVSIQIPALGSGVTRLESANGVDGEPIDEVDYRDRLVWISGVVTSTATTVGEGPAVSDASGTWISACFYTGPFGSVSVVLGDGVEIRMAFGKGESGRGVHAELYFSNSNGTARWLNAMLECSGQLGLSDNRTTGL